MASLTVSVFAVFVVDLVARLLVPVAPPVSGLLAPAPVAFVSLLILRWRRWSVAGDSDRGNKLEGAGRGVDYNIIVV